MRQTTLNFNDEPASPRKAKKRHAFESDEENDDIICLNQVRRVDRTPHQRPDDDEEFTFGVEGEVSTRQIGGPGPSKKPANPMAISTNDFTIVANSNGSYFEKDRNQKKQQQMSKMQRIDAEPPKPTNGFVTAGGCPIETIDFDYKNTKKDVKPKKTQVKVNFPYPAISVLSSKSVKSQFRCPSLNMAIRQELPSEQMEADKTDRDVNHSQESLASVTSALSNPPATTSQNGLKGEPTLKHFEEHLIDMIESEIMVLHTDISWEDVAGLDGAKKSLREIVVLPFKRPDLFTGIRAPAKGVLLFGPPGTGKTMIGRCVASQCNATFFNISASSLTSKWVGEGEKLVRALFAIARLKLPSVIFIDEIDSLLSCRKDNEHESSRRIKTEFLVQLDGIATSSEERLLILGATNRPQELDEAARRRFAKRLYIALPCANARNLIISSLIADQKHSIHNSDDLEKISSLTEGYSGADMRQLCAEAAMAPIRDIDSLSSVDFDTVSVDDIRPISVEDFYNALKVVRPTVVEEDLVAYKDWDRKFGCLL